MSSLRPTLKDADPRTPCMSNGTAYLMILNAVQTQPGLLHGKLETSKGEYCAIGSYFHVNKGTCLPDTLINEVAAVNDSVPTLSPRRRKLHMLRWLRWKLVSVGMPGYARAKKP